jgi:phosphoglycerate dehydrogenase-like enzyme
MSSALTVVLPDEAIAARLGELPDEVRVVVWDGTGAFPAGSDVAVWMPPFAQVDIAGIADGLPALRVIHLPTAGADQLPERLRTDVTVHTMRGVHDSAVSEWIVAAMLAVTRDLHTYTRQQAAGRPRLRVSRRLDGSRITVLGYGSIGRALEDRLCGFDVALTRVARTARPGVLSVDELDAVLPETDVLVVLAPLTPGTRSLVGAERLALLPDGALVINAGRGPVVDQEALAAELGARRLRAALDLSEPDPLPDGHALLAEEDLLYTPHIAGVTADVYPRMGTFFGDQLRRMLRGEALHNAVAVPAATGAVA